MSSSNWSTNVVQRTERFSYWREVVSHTILNVATEAPPETGFSAEISGHAYGHMRIARFQSEKHRIVRSQFHVRRAEEGTFLISLQRKGASHINQNGISFDQKPGDISVVDSRRPFDIQFADPVDRIIVVIPDFVLEPRVPSLRRESTLKIDHDNQFADLTREHLLRLASLDDEGTEHEADLLTANICNLIALAVRPSHVEAKKSDQLFERIISHCKLNLFDPALSPVRVATHFGISVRALHLRFQHTGETFGSWVLRHRLDACDALLRDSKQADIRISEIAFGLGFNDLSHFCRVFKTKFGYTAREAKGLAS